jgi:hypothetical protein
MLADPGERPSCKRGALMRKRVASIIGTLMVSLGIVVLVASPAAAAETNYAVDADWNSDPKTCMSEVTIYTRVDGCFEQDGDILWIQDKKAEGYGVALMWDDLDSDRSGRCIHALGADKAWAVCNKDFTEGHRIRFWVQWDSVDGWQTSTYYIDTYA